MKSNVEHLNPTRVKLTVEVPFDELRPQFDKAYKALAGQVRIPGFRPGKVPARILDARLGRSTILSEVVNEAVPVKYGEAISEAQLIVLGQPEIEVTRIDDGDALAFTAEVDVRPEITLPDLSGIAVEVDDVQVTDADIDEQVEALRERFAATTAVDRAATDGDLVTLDLRAAIDAEELPDATADGLSYRVGEGDLVEGIDEAVTGMSAGDVSVFRTTLVAGEHAGEEADVTVAVTAVQERTLPEVDDDFAQLASEFDTVEALRVDLAEKIRRVKNLSQGAQARDRVLDALIAATDIPTPQGIVEAEFKSREHDAIHAFDHDEARFTAYLDGEGKTKEAFDAELREGAEQAVRAQLLLDALAEAGEYGVNQEEFTERLIYNAQRAGVAPEEYFKRLQEANQIGAVFADVRRGKALAGAVEQATVTNASGERLDVAALFGIEEVSAEEQSPAERAPDGQADDEQAAGDQAADGQASGDQAADADATGPSAHDTPDAETAEAVHLAEATADLPDPQAAALLAESPAER